MIKEIVINSIWEGTAPSQYFGQEGTFIQSLAIDPDYPISTAATDIKTSGFAVPVGYAVFSTTANINSPPIAIINNPKDSLTYVALANGRLISYNTSLASETFVNSAQSACQFTVTIASPAVFTLTAHGLAATSSTDSTVGDIVYFSTTGALPTGLTAGTAYYVISAGLTANAFQVSTSAGGTAVNTSGTQSGTHTITMAIGGAAYYNNYIYLFTRTNVSRYGPLDTAASTVFAHNVWVGTTLGSQTALTTQTYPSLRSVTIPNHWAFVHGDGSMYFCDFINGQGKIHRINTKKVTVEGDTNGTVTASSYGVLTLPFGFYPTTIVGVNTNLMILGIYTVNTTIQQGKSAFVLWDPTNTTSFFLGPVPLPDSLATAALNNNGEVYIWTGNAVNGVKLSKYLGGISIQDILFQEEGLPPFAGAVDAVGNRIVWGSFTTNPAAAACIWAYGSKDARLPAGLHNVVKSSSAGTTPIVTAVKYVQQTSYIQPRVVLAFRDGTNSGLDSYSSSATLASRIRWLFNVGQKFSIEKIRIPLAGAVDSTTSITSLISFDDLSNQAPPTIPTGTTALPVINNTNYPSKRKVIYKAAQLKSYVGINNFILELLWGNTTAMPVAFPIRIKIKIWEDES